MSYASVASHNIPEGEMPKPDQSLLDGTVHSEHEHNAIHQEDKINVLPPGTDLAHPPVDNEPTPAPAPVTLSSAAEPEVKTLHVAPTPAEPKPYKEPEVSEKVEKAEGKAKGAAKEAEKKGKEYAKKAKKELREAESALAPYWEQTKEIVLRPGTLGGLVGVFNLAVLGTVGYFGYKHWNQRWDKRVVSAVTVGLLSLSGLEGWAGKVYKEKELPKHK